MNNKVLPPQRISLPAEHSGAIAFRPSRSVGREPQSISCGSSLPALLINRSLFFPDLTVLFFALHGRLRRYDMMRLIALERLLNIKLMDFYLDLNCHLEEWQATTRDSLKCVELVKRGRLTPGHLKSAPASYDSGGMQVFY